MFFLVGRHSRPLRRTRHRDDPKPCLKSCSTLSIPGASVITNSAGTMNRMIGNRGLILKA